MKSFFVAFFLICGLSVFACLNEYHVSKHGKESSDFYLGETTIYKNHDQKELLERLKKLQTHKLQNAQDSLENQNNIAVVFIKLGKLDAAEKILNYLLQKYPGEYSVIINLGTLYELQGKNQMALDYIHKALTLDSNSHLGSEWFHVKVLEYKLRKVPASEIPNQDILGLSAKGSDAGETAMGVLYQLQERIPFTPAPDPMMAKILSEYGDFLADKVSISVAYIIYGIGREYDAQNHYSFEKKQQSLVPYFSKYKEAIPSISQYYKTPENVNSEKQIAEGINLFVDKGLDFIKAEEKRKAIERKRQQAFVLWSAVGGVVVLSLLAFLIFKRRKTA